MNPPATDTICAISSPVGAGAIGIVRLSGPQAQAIAARMFRAADGRALDALDSHSLCYGHVVDGPALVDEVLLAVMRAPKTYTREDVIEIHCHGGLAAVRAVLELALAQGARLAEAGEFTRRAFVNGRIDLTQVEAVLDVISARTRAGLRAAAKRLEGGLGRRIRALAESLTSIRVRLEACIDFPDEEIPAEVLPAVALDVNRARAELRQLEASADSGLLYRLGARVALAGKPNVGKSSLFNRLVRENRAIVTAEPGTTRDVLSETINLRGVPVTLTDAAGLRDPEGEPESIGVAFAQAAIEQADLVLLVFDASRPLDAEDLAAADTVARLSRATLVVGNKADLPDQAGPRPGSGPLAGETLATSAVTGAGIADLEQTIAARVVGGELLPPGEALVASARELACVERAGAALDAFSRALDQGLPIDVAAIDLAAAMSALGELVGQVSSEELLDRIFGEFCIGK